MVLPEVLKSLRERQVQHVMIVGIESHVCVLQSTLDLLQEGFNVFVLADAVSSCNAGERNVAFEVRLRSLSARLQPDASPAHAKCRRNHYDH